MSRTVVVAGVGPGLGASVARRFAIEGCRVALFARSESYIDELAAELDEDSAGEALAVPTDLTDPDAIESGFEAVRDAFGPVDVLVNHASGGSWKGLTDLSQEEFDRALDVGARGAFLCSQEAVGDMLGNDNDNDDGDTGGTVIFTGATSAIRGRDGALAFSAAKFAARGMAQSMARELGPKGIHVAHVVVDGGISPPNRTVENPEEYLDPDAIADSYWHLVEQDESAWTLELDLRPHVEKF
ncbi:short-chain dehydrogenase [Haloprofundus marisrubri]|uniref:Short-chain dehydrogenase n=1 Tax=Haloprofundus marisrubri TaxID=1514971 RepID=A0A0W1R4I7_9EURY|nr:SDR family NAD(P)-dependent oxidoreductase [Haloprofundus marisrubri]KTG08150.1 short-chain dehydrogenase [Haloprofundus marisrubri]